MANVSGASLAPIYNRLNAAPSYHPLEAETFADWSLEAGDIVTVTRDGKSYESPVHSSTVTWKKGQQVKVSSGGNEERDSVSKMSQRKFNRGSSGLRATEERYRQIETSYNGMRSGLILASSSAALYVNNKYTQMQSGLFLTESSAHLYTNNRYTQMQSGLKLTESSAHLYTNNKYTQMQSGLKLTESSAHLYTNNRYTQMQSGLKLTESSARLYVENKYTQMSSGLSLSSSSAALYVNNKYTQMQSGLVLSESSARLYVDSKYTQMQAGLALTESSAMLYARNRTTSAQIIARINERGQGEALISADNVAISGNTTISGMLTINTDGALYVKNDLVIITSGKISTKKIAMQNDGSITFPDAGGNIGTMTLNNGNIAKFFTALKVVTSGNGYKMQYKSLSDTSWTDLPDSSFSRAVSSWVWGGGDGKINVTALPQNQTCPVKVSIDGPTSITANGEYTYTVDYENGDGDDVSTGKTKTVTVSIKSAADYYNASSYWKKPQDNNGVCTVPNIGVTAAETWFSMSSISMTRAGWHSVSGNVYYGKLYYWDDDDESYNPVVNSNKYWYYSGSSKSGTTTFYY